MLIYFWRSSFCFLAFLSKKWGLDGYKLTWSGDSGGDDKMFTRAKEGLAFSGGKAEASLSTFV